MKHEETPISSGSTYSASPDTDILSDQDHMRLAALEGYAIVDAPAEASFDRITRIVSAALDTPAAFITFVEAPRIWFKSTIGANV